MQTPSIPATRAKGMETARDTPKEPPVEHLEGRLLVPWSTTDSDSIQHHCERSREVKPYTPRRVAVAGAPPTRGVYA